LNFLINKILRLSLSLFFWITSFIVRGIYIVRILLFRYNQKKLKKKYNVQNIIPASYNDDLEKRMNDRYKQGDEYAFTSGSSSKPKKILYPKERLQNVKKEYVYSLFNLLKRDLSFKTLFIISSLSDDNSLSDMMTRDKKTPSRIELLQAPYRALKLDALKMHTKEYGIQALRVFIIYISRPRVIYATNPSSIVTLHDSLEESDTFKFINDFVNEKISNQKDIEKIVNRITDRRTYSKVDRAESLLELNHNLKGFISWDGGYVKAYLKRLKKAYPEVLHYPLFSMSTENVETLNYKKLFLPIYPKTLYEFKTLDNKLLDAKDIKVGQEYEMIISNQYGLQRYCTDDIFLCHKKVFGVPSLIFQKRKSLSSSFTGEKITAEQVLELTSQLQNKYPISTLSLIGHLDKAKYTLAIIASNTFKDIQAEELTEDFEKLLKSINSEFKDKRESNRLEAFDWRVYNSYEFISFIKNDNAENWESQFKFLPIYLLSC
jgi:hypothetical protein